MEKKRLKITVGQPSKGLVRSDTNASMWSLAYRFGVKHKPGDEEHRFTHTTGRTEVGRNTIVERAFEHGSTHVLFIDSDMEFDYQMVEMLIDADKDIIGCNAAGRETGNPVIPSDIDGNLLNYATGEEIKEVDFVGMALTLINLDVFRKMAMPWFEAPARPGTNVIISEDVTFCRKARKLYGYKVYCHLRASIAMGHVGDRNNKMFPYFMAQVEALKAGLPLPIPPNFIRVLEK